MATVIPFRGVLFDEKKAGAIAELVCPPYDIISHDEQQALYRTNAHNVIRLEFGLESPADTAIDNRYTRAAATLDEWMRTAILRKAAEPAFYFQGRDTGALQLRYKINTAQIVHGKKIAGLPVFLLPVVLPPAWLHAATAQAAFAPKIAAEQTQA